MPGADWVDLATEATKSAIELLSELAAKDWKEAARRTIDQANIVRFDFVDFKYEPVSALRFLSLTNLSPAWPGVMYATRDRNVGWIRESIGGPGWERREVPASAIKWSIPLGEGGMKTVSHASPTSLRLELDGKRMFVLFMGFVPERFQTSSFDKVLGRIPAINGLPVGTFYTTAKMIYQQRGSLGRSRAALEFWAGLLSGKLDLESYELAVLKRLKEMGTAGLDPVGISLGHLANALCIDVEDADLRATVADELRLDRSRFEAASLLETILGTDPEHEAGVDAGLNKIIAACRSMVVRFRSSADPWLKSAVAAAYLNWGQALLSKEAYAQALDPLNALLDEAGDQAGEVPAYARFYRATALENLNRNDEAIGDVGQVLSQKLVQDDPHMVELKARASSLRDLLMTKLQMQLPGANPVISSPVVEPAHLKTPPRVQQSITPGITGSGTVEDPWRKVQRSKTPGIIGSGTVEDPWRKC